jgi:hypothetical protein
VLDSIEALDEDIRRLKQGFANEEEWDCRRCA